MQYTFQMPAKETLEFQMQIQREFARKVTPRWITFSFGYSFYIAVAGAAYFISGKFWTAYWIFIATAILLRMMQRSYAALVRNRTIKHLKNQPDSETWVVEITDGYLCTENRGVRLCFGLENLTDTKEEKGLLIFRFGDRGAVRMPVSVFSTSGARDAFLAEINGRMGLTGPEGVSAS